MTEKGKQSPVNARYKAKTNTHGSSIDMTNPELPNELSQMIIWVMHHAADAMYLLPEYSKIRQQAEDRDEGGAKNRALEVVRDYALEHMRHCRECSETDVANCPTGEPLWDAAMPTPAAEVGAA